jgi:protein phosphatase
MRFGALAPRSRTPAREIVIPEPSLIVMVGAAGSGKSTFAARHFAATEILSSDQFRAIVSGDEADQSATRGAFSLLHRELDRRLAAGSLTVVDATNVQRRARRALLVRGNATKTAAVAIVLDLPPAMILARNADRARVVDPTVVDRHLAHLRRALDGPEPPIEGEGFAEIVVLHDHDEVDRVRFRRVRR